MTSENVNRRDLASVLGIAVGALALSKCAPATLDGGTGRQQQGLTGITFTTADTIADLRGMAPPGTPPIEIVMVLGYYADGDGGGGLFYYDSTCALADDGGITIVPNSLSGDGGLGDGGDAGIPAGRWRRVFDGVSVSVKWFGAKGDGVNSDSDAFDSAIHALCAVATNINSDGYTVLVPAGTYYLARTLKVDRAVVLRGATGSGWFASSILKFPVGIDGIWIYRATPTDLNRADWAVIQDLAVISTASTSGAGNGILMEATASVERCWIQNFAGDGIHIHGSLLASGTSASMWHVQFVEIDGCDNGMYVTGPDANAGRAIGASAIGNRKWGIYDSSFLGNTYIACHTNGNGTLDPTTYGSYKTDVSTSSCMFVNCYAEAGQIASVLTPSMVLGGTFAPDTGTVGIGVPAGYLSMAGSVLTSRPLIRGLNSSQAGAPVNGPPPAPVAVHAWAAVGGLAYGEALSFGAYSADETTDVSGTWRFRYGCSTVRYDFAEVGVWSFNHGNVNNGNALNLYGATSARWSEGPVGAKAGIQHLYTGYDETTLHTSASAMPTSGTWPLGARVYNSAPTELGTSGSKYILDHWICVAAGSPGTWLESRCLTGN